MKKYLISLSCLLYMTSSYAQNTINIASGTKVVGSGTVQVASNANNFVNNGSYNDVTGTFRALGAMSFSGSGTTVFNYFTVNNAGSTSLGSQVSVMTNATLTAGSLATGSGNLYIRTDLNPLANLSVTGILTGTTQGLIAIATVTSGACPVATTLSTNVSGPAMQYQWQSSADGSVYSNISGATSATYAASVNATRWYRCNLTTNNSGYVQATAGVLITTTGGPSISAGTGTIVCSGSAASLTATGGVSYVWAPSAGLSSTVGASVNATPAITTTYTVTGSDAGGCLGTSTVTVSVNPSPSVISGPGGGGIITTVAGNGSVGHTGDGGPATSASVSFNYPRKLRYDASGNLYISDQASIRKISTSGTITTIVGTGTTGFNSDGIPATAALVSNPYAIAFDAAGNMYFNDVNNFRIRKVDHATNLISTYVGGPFGGPSYLPDGSAATATWVLSTSLAFDAAGDLHYYDYNNNIIRKVNHVTGLVTTIAGTPGVSGYSGDNGPATGAKFRGNGGESEICFHANGDLYIVDSRNNRIRKIDHVTNVITTVAGTGFGADTFEPHFSGDGGAATNAQISLPQGLAFDGAGNMYIIDAYNQRVRIVDATGTINTYAGTGTGGFSGDGGSATSAQLYYPAGGIFDANGNFLISDVGNHRIRKVSATAASLTVCVGSSATLSNATAGGSWMSNNGNAAVGVSTGLVTGVSAGTSVITYMTPGGCYSTTVVTVNALPATSVGSGVSICGGTSTTLSASGATTYQWTPVGGLSATTGASVIATPSVTTSYTVKGFSNGCSANALVTVTVMPTPAVNAGSDLSICIGSLTHLAASGATTYVWSPAASVSTTTGFTVSTSPTVTTTYTVVGTTGSCTNSATVTVSVNALPTVSAGPNQVICIGSGTTITATGSSQYIWVPAIGLSATTGATVTASPTVTTTYTVTGGVGSCSNAATVTVSVNPLANAGTISGPNEVCQNANITLVSNGLHSGSWSSASSLIGTVSATGVVTGIGPGETVITYAVTNDCGSITATYPITVNPLPAVPSAITGPTELCAGTNISLVNAGSGGSWTSSNSGQATVSGAGVVSGLAAGAVIISYTNTNGCGSASAVYPITVNPVPSTISGTLFVCPGAITTLTNSPGGGVWSSADATVSVTATNGKVTGITPGTALISYSLPAGCVATAIVTVTPPPSAIGGTLTVCPGATTTLTNAATGGTWTSSAIAKATVDEATGVVTAVSPGVVVITYTLSAGCFNTTVVTVNAAPEEITGALTLCPGNTTTLASLTGGGVWTSNNTAIATVNASTGIVTSVAGVGTATINYTVGVLCPRSVTVTVATPSPNTGDQVVCLGQPVSVALLSNATAGGSWTSSNPDRILISSSTGYLRGLTVGTAIVTYHLDAGCFSTTEMTVNAAVGAITGVANICPGSSTILTNPTPGGIWSSTNTAVATAGTGGIFTGISEGTSIISYSVSAGCYKTINMTVYGFITDISGSALICQGSNSTLASGPSGGTWSSNNTTRATVNISSGVVTGVSAGTAVITYKLGSSGCYVTRVVTVSPSVATITGTANICPGATNSLANSDGGGVWSSSNPASATIDGVTGFVGGIAAGTSVISYVVTPSCYKTFVQTVNALPGAITGGSSVCDGSVITLSSSTGGTWSSSNTAAATISTSGVVAGIAPGNTTITYSVSSTGCQVTQDISVNATPAIITGSLAACLGVPSPLASATGGGVWTSGNIVKATVDPALGIVTGLQTGTTNITYTVSTGCFRKVVVTVFAPPSALTGKDTVCAGLTTALSSTTTGGTWSSSVPATATVSTGGLVRGLSSGVVVITYKIPSSGCQATRQVTVNGLPDAISGTLSLCIGVPQTLSSSGGGVWSSGAVAKATIGASTGVVTGVSAGSANITYTLPTGCISKTTVTVNPSPVAITGPTSVNVGSTATLVCTPGGGAWSSLNVPLATVVTGGIVTGVSDGVATIRYTLGNGCFSARDISVVTPASKGIADETATGNSLFAVYPNPTAGSLTINSSVHGLFSVFTIDGRMVGQFPIDAEITAISLPYDLASGIYMCRFAGIDGSSKMVRIVLNK
jgi:uncharacterized protein YjdB/sugar lactone lactonase YvrE